MPEQKKIVPKKAGCGEMLSDPCSYVTVLTYFLCAAAGGGFAIYSFTGGNMNWVSPAFLVVVSVYATYEIRLLGKPFFLNHF